MYYISHPRKKENGVARRAVTADLEFGVVSVSQGTESCLSRANQER